MTDTGPIAGAGVLSSSSSVETEKSTVKVHYLKNAPSFFHVVDVGSYTNLVGQLRTAMISQSPPDGWRVDLNKSTFGLCHVAESEAVEAAVRAAFKAQGPKADINEPLTAFLGPRRLAPRFVAVGTPLPPEIKLSGVKRSRAAARLDDRPRGGTYPDLMAQLVAVMRLNDVITPRARRASLGNDAAPAMVHWNSAGDHFQFVNRDEQAVQLLEAFCEMEALRTESVKPGKSRWEVLRRRLKVPVCTGMPGFGKTRFAREAIHRLAEVAKREHNDSDILSAALKVACPNKGLTRALVNAHYCDCNLHLECVKGWTEESVAMSLLWEWRKQFIGESDISMALSGRGLTIKAAVCFILENTPKDEGGDGIPALIVNLDEASNLSIDELGALLRCFLHLLINAQLRVFVTVTGVNADRIDEALHSSMVGPCNITLSLLQQHHMEEILADFFPEQRDELKTSTLRHALWWLGGVPRFLEFFVQEAAKLAKQYSRTRECLRAPVGEWLARLNTARGLDLIDSVSAVAYERYFPMNDALDGAFTLAVVGAKVSRKQLLTDTTTVDMALQKDLLYWAPVDRKTSSGRWKEPSGVICMPPLVLRWTQKHLPEDFPQLSVLRYMIPFLTTRDNETIAASVLLHKFCAFSKLGYRSVNLSQLGIPTHPEFIRDVKVCLPQTYELTNVGSSVTSSNFDTFLAQCKKEEAVGYINMPTASFADAIVLLPDFIIFIQEKQRVLARLARQGGRAPRKRREADLHREYETLGDARRYPHVFLYITDDDEPISRGWLKNACFVTPRNHRALLGDVCAYLRKQTF